MKVAREYRFTPAEVKDWCNQAGDSNQIHLNEDAIEESDVFESRVVPGVMLLDRVSGLISEWGEVEGGTPVLSQMNSVTWEEPLHFSEDVTISLSDEDKDEPVHILSFEAVSNGEILMDGYATVYLF